ncbi:Hypothetical predicted protein [Mytilus galloprovincialis]|uniref:BEN domain-containing protein n=1 Tax=Mytilus galloprovincialis TaxID=29158 RepID=A0A8B6F929_MYTGA|nr:Hypothetical predicted protein [Mytilus galloprovincialis]
MKRDEKKATVIRRSQQPLPTNPVDQDDQVEQDIATPTYTTLTPTTSQPVNTPSLNPFLSTFSQPDHQTTVSSVPVSSSNPFSNQSPTNQLLPLINPFLDTSHTSTNPFLNTSQSTYENSLFNSPTTNPFLSTHQPFLPSSQANHSQSAVTPIQPINSPSHLPDIFRFPEPTTPTTPFPDIHDRLTPVNRRPLTDRKFDGVYQRLATLEKNQTEIKNNQQAIMSMLSTVIHQLQGQGSNSTPPSTLYQCQPIATNPETYPFLDVPEIYRITMADLNSMNTHSNCPGHLATKLLERLFPELFTTQNYRLQHSYHGGGKCNKTELPYERKTVFQRYVLYFYPGLSEPRAWKDAIIPRVNEYLRRPATKQ